MQNEKDLQTLREMVWAVEKHKRKRDQSCSMGTTNIYLRNRRMTKNTSRENKIRKQRYWIGFQTNIRSIPSFCRISLKGLKGEWCIKLDLAGEAQRKMQFARRTSSSIENVPDGGSRAGALSRKSLGENNNKASSKDREVPALIWMNSDQRYTILTFVTLEPDARWKFVTPFFLPLQGPGAHVNIGSIDQVSLSPIISFHVDPQKAKRGHPPDSTCSAKPFTARSCSGSNVLLQSRNRGLMNIGTKLTRVSCSSQRNSLISSDYSALIPDASDATSSADLVKDISKVNKPMKRNSRKKAKKKGKRNKKTLCCIGSTELHAFSEGVHGSSTSGTCGNSDMACGDKPIPENNLSENAIAPEVLLREATGNETDCEDNINGINTHSETSTTCASYSDEADESEAIIPSAPKNFTGDHLVNNTEDGVQTKDTVYSAFKGGAAHMHIKQTTYCDATCAEVLSDVHSAPMLDSVSDGWNSDSNTSRGNDVEEQPSTKGDGINPSEPPGNNLGKQSLSRGNFLKGVVDSYNHVKGTKCDSQDRSNSKMNLVSSGKRGRQGRKVPGNSSVYKFSSGGNLHGHKGKENNHSVWQKVRRNDANECICEPKKVNPVCTLFDMASKEAPLLKRSCNIVDSDALLNTEDHSILKAKDSGKLKRKPRTVLKQESQCYSKKGSHAIKANSNRHAKIKRQHKEASDIPFKVNHHKEVGSVSDCPKVGLQTNRVDCTNSELVQSLQVFLDEKEPLQVFLDEKEPLGSVCTTVSSMNDQATQSQNSSLSRSFGSLNQSDRLQVQSPVDLHTSVGNGLVNVNTEVSHVEFNKQDHYSGSVLQKWIPIGRKDVGLTSTSKSDDLSLSRLGQSVADGWILDNTEEDDLSSNAHSLVSSMNAGEICMGQSSENVNDSPPEDEDQVNQCISREHSCMHGATNCFLNHESKDHNISVFETDSHKIARVVNEAYRIQLASERVQLATGSPVAEFERLLHFASPVLHQTHSLFHCRTCLRDQLTGASLCRHETPNISLGSLWQWYEKHGSYGLEVRAEDYQNSKRLSIDRCEFRAYFVPLLSAVQLFGNRTSHHRSNSNGIPTTKVLKACEMNEASENSSDIGRLPILSILVPQPHREDTEILPPVNQFCSSEPSSASGKEELSNHSLSPACSDDSELLFEYFESEQPQQRRPLFENIFWVFDGPEELVIKELVRGDGPSNSRAYGDPTKLDSSDLHDLHPRTWIPDGNLRAAFLTYHSLGHLIRRSASSDSLGGDTCIVSPVVGLQSYNAQEVLGAVFLCIGSLLEAYLAHNYRILLSPDPFGIKGFIWSVCFVGGAQNLDEVPSISLDATGYVNVIYWTSSNDPYTWRFADNAECWFQVRQSVVAEETSSLNPSKILKDRLRSLEQTASVMARDVVSKVDLRSVNWQPDYEFFLSRRRW
ncbi:hypothetical protein HHK36_014581 [Tetracentron sinense]|uniref:Uncharacterized protein n=1 Tax=Tetracentron sinense TaxID=13715 RepID=A0A834Z5T9_TETSI|nr:hypothetical protein HHK36_014581 [Tetracentron sinense]